MAANVKGRGNGSAEAHKEKAIALAISTIEKQFGKGAILKMTEDAIDREVQSFSSGALSRRCQSASQPTKYDTKVALMNSEMTAYTSHLVPLRQERSKVHGPASRLRFWYGLPSSQRSSGRKTSSR